AALNGETARQKEVPEAKKAAINTTITEDEVAAIQPGKMNTVNGTAHDQYDNRTAKTTEQYVRKYDVMEDTNLDIAVDYIPFLGSKWKKCLTGETDPDVGHYSITDKQAINRHIDQMEYAGISTVMFVYEHGHSSQSQFNAFKQHQLADEIEIEVIYSIGHALQWNTDKDFRDVLKTDLDFFKEEMFTIDSYKTYYNQPTVSLWDINFLAWGGNEQSRQVKAKIMDEFGGFEEFIGFIRSELSGKDNSPYLIGDIHDTALGGLRDKYIDLDSQLDAVTTWTGKLDRGQKTPWNEAYKHVKKNFQATSEFASEYNIDFIPRAFPGFDDRHNSCWGEDRYVPRSPSHLQHLLELANKYRTRDRINIATWNGWPEGHMIEPGAFQGTDYGTAYLETVKEFQKGGLR
ncbi:MAG: hypothetical protein ABEI86_10480, partial [Halobacteriaceae archaeon]